MPEIYVPNSNADVPLQRVLPGRQGVFHPDNIEVPAGINDPAFGAAKEAFTYLYDGIEAADAFRGNQSEEDRAATHDRKTGELVDRTQDVAAEKLTRALGEVQRALANVDARIAEKAGLKPDPAWRNAVVGTFHDMPNDGARAAGIAELIERGDYASLAALLEAPLIVTKLRPEVRDTIKERVFAKVDPQGVRHRDALAKVLTRIDAAGNASVSIFAKLREGTHQGAAKERARKAAALNLNANLGNR